MSQIVNQYAVCLTPDPDAEVWGRVKSVAAYSLDNAKVILKYPEGEAVPDADRITYGMDVYNHQGILAVLRSAEFQRDNRNARIFDHVRAAKRWTDLTALDWDDDRGTMTDKVEYVDVIGTGMNAGMVETREVYGKGGTVPLPMGGRAAKPGAQPLIRETHTHTHGTFGPTGRKIVFEMLARDGTVWATWTRSEGLQQDGSGEPYDRDTQIEKGKGRRSRVWLGIQGDLGTAAALNTPPVPPVQAAALMLTTDAVVAKSGFVDGSVAQPVVDYLDVRRQEPAYGWITQVVRDSLVQKWLIAWGAT